VPKRSTLAVELYWSFQFTSSYHIYVRLLPLILFICHIFSAQTQTVLNYFYSLIHFISDKHSSGFCKYGWSQIKPFRDFYGQRKTPSKYCPWMERLVFHSHTSRVLPLHYSSLGVFVQPESDSLALCVGGHVEEWCLLGCNAMWLLHKLTVGGTYHLHHQDDKNRRARNNVSSVRFEVFTAETMKNGVFWDVTPCGSCKNRRFGRT
jgi:hypothetical protein